MIQVFTHEDGGFLEFSVPNGLVLSGAFMHIIGRDTVQNVSAVLGSGIILVPKADIQKSPGQYIAILNASVGSGSFVLHFEDLTIVDPVTRAQSLLT